MKRTQSLFVKGAKLCVFAAWLGWAANVPAALLLNFPFNEGTGGTTADTASGLVGVLGVKQDPSVDYVQLTDDAPSGAVGDRSVTTFGDGFLMVKDSPDPILNITNGPITIECWINITPGPGKPNEGIAAYGASYKLGLKGSRQVFTLYGKVDITNSAAGFMPAGVWTHLAAVWKPGEGVDFYVNGVHSFVANTNTTARVPLHDYLSIGSEGFVNSLVASYDRLRIHHAALTESEIDSDAANPKPTYSSTLVAYNFNEAGFPVDNAIAPSRPSQFSSDVIPLVTHPQWTSDTPTGMSGDYALDFPGSSTLRESIAVDYGETPIDLGANGTNYTFQAWIKLPTEPMEARRVIFRTAGVYPRGSFSINADRCLHTTIYGVQDYFSSVVVPNDNRWHHVAAAVEDFERVHFYLDGVLRQTIEKTDPRMPTTSGTGGLLIGKESETLYYRGLLDRVIIHNNVLTAEELDYPAVPGLAVFQTHPSGLLVNDGGTATFTATVSSPTAATYQWFRRADLADPVGTPVADANSTTLTLNNVSVDDEGVYSLLVTNAAGVAESYGARLTIRPSSAVVAHVNFDPPTYAEGPIAGQDSWILSGTATNGTHVQTESVITTQLSAIGITEGEPVHSGSQAFFFFAPGGASSTVIRPISGLEGETKVIMDVWARGLSRGTTVAPIGNVFFAIEGTAQTTGRAAFIGFRTPSSTLTNTQNIDYGSGTMPGNWIRSGVLFDETEWYKLTAIFDYSAKTYAFFIDEKEIASNVPFVHAVSDYFRQLRVFRGANQVGMIVDDLTLSIPQVPGAPGLGIRREGDDIIVFWPASVTDYVLEGTENFTAPSWNTVPHTTVGDENRAVLDTAGPSLFLRLKK